MSKKLTVIFAALFFAVAAGLGIWLWPYIVKGQALEYLSSLGAASLPAFMGLFILQILAAFIPGEPLEIAAGMLYGPVWGCLCCVACAFIGTLVIYFAVKSAGAHPPTRGKLARLRFLTDPKVSGVLVFLLFVMPGTPKDALCFLGPFLPISRRRFLLYASVGRIPSIITSTFAGSAVGEGRWGAAAVWFAASAAAALAGFVTARLIERRHQQKSAAGGDKKDMATEPERSRAAVNPEAEG